MYIKLMLKKVRPTIATRVIVSPGLFVPLLLACLLMPCRGLAVYVQATNPTVVNMKHVGAQGDGITDDSAAIQAAIDTAPDNTTFYFPAGTYRLHNIEVANRFSLQFVGDGPATILQWRGTPKSYTAIMTFSGVTHLLIQNMTWDNRAIPTYGGVRFYNVKDVHIQNTRFFDSNPQPLINVDRYSYVFGYGIFPSEDIHILNNVIEHLQLEVDHARHVEIKNNLVMGGTETAGIGLFTLGDGTVLEDFLIEGNTIIDPAGRAAGIAIRLDPPTTNDGLVRQIRILNNTIIRTTSSGIGISLGTTYVLAPTTGNRFEDITVQGNVLWTHASAPAQHDFIRILSSGDFVFARLSVQDNLIIGNGTGTNDGVGIAVRYPTDARIRGNTMRRVLYGTALVGAESTFMQDNLVEASGFAYFSSYSAGNNTFLKNHYLGSPAAVLLFEEAPAASDLVESPAPMLLGKTPPRLSQIQVTSSSAQEVTISWRTNKPATTEVEYGRGKTYNTTTYPRAPLTHNHAVTLSNLTLQTRYIFRVRSIDSTGQEAVSGPRTFITRRPFFKPYGR